jgi:nicotinamidase/pyrazinamidase
MKIESTDAFIGVDMQRAFISMELPVRNARQIIRPMGEFMKNFSTVVLTRDWHPKDHISFGQWGEHAVAGTPSAEIIPNLDQRNVSMIINKGMNPLVDSYSAFYDDVGTRTGLRAFLDERGVKRVFIGGLAYEYCVGYTALHAKASGFETVVVESLTRGLETQAVAKMIHELVSAGVEIQA